MQNSPDVGSALSSFVRYFHLHAQGSIVTLETEGKHAYLGYKIYQPKVVATEHIEDGAVAIAFNILKQLCGEDWKPTEVCFSHREPKKLKPFQDFFITNLTFNSEYNGIFFPVHWLKQPVQKSDPELYKLLQKQIKQLDTEVKDNFPEQVRRVLHTVLITNHASKEQVAALFSMHSRTLQRQLKLFNTSFHELTEQVRYDISRQMLSDSKIKLPQVTDMLGYAEVRSFNRAFKRWSGTTPTLWRIDKFKKP